jgi:hypothetical protein
VWAVCHFFEVTPWIMTTAPPMAATAPSTFKSFLLIFTSSPCCLSYFCDAASNSTMSAAAAPAYRHPFGAFLLMVLSIVAAPGTQSGETSADLGGASTGPRAPFS